MGLINMILKQKRNYNLFCGNDFGRNNCDAFNAFTMEADMANFGRYTFNCRSIESFNY